MANASASAFRAIPGIPLFNGGEDVGEIIVEKCGEVSFELVD